MLALLANIILQGLEGEFIKSVRQIMKQKRTLQCQKTTKFVFCEVKTVFIGGKMSKYTHHL